MNTWKQRVITEKKELDIKIEKLETFLKDASNISDISVYTLFLLSEQLFCMKTYSFILNERLRGENE